jgi:hypothetical protein
MTAPPQPLLHGDLPCPSCGYLRAGLPLERACPECGAAGFEGLVIASGTSLPPATPVVKPLTYLALGLLGCLAALIAVSFLVAPEAGRQIRTLLIPCSVPLVVGGAIVLGVMWWTVLRHRPGSERSAEREVWEVWPTGVRVRSPQGTEWIARERMYDVTVHTRFDLSATVITITDPRSLDLVGQRLHLRGPIAARRMCAARIREVLGFA